MNLPKLLVQLMLAVLFTHELDAMTQSEWRLLYVLRDLGDEQGRWWFTALHVPLFGALLGLAHHSNLVVERASRTTLAVFCIVHALLHLRLRNDPMSTFDSPMSWGLILGAAVLGLAYLSITIYQNRTRYR
jgi:hypothetical protein